MAVVREITAQNYALDRNGAVISNEASRQIDQLHPRGYVPIARRCYPIDNYDISPSLQTSQLVTKLRILKVPLLGQAGYEDNWCGRTSSSMIYNWFQLVAKDGERPKARYITHWDAGRQDYLLDLRNPQGYRVFTYPAETALSNVQGYSYGLFAEGYNSALQQLGLGARYNTQSASIHPFARNRAEEGRKIAADEERLRRLFQVVIQSVEMNNPVFIYSGFTRGKNHLIVLAGYALIRGEGGEELWLAVADPATQGWIPAQYVLDLSGGKGNLDQDLRSEHRVVRLVEGNWTYGRGTFSLVKASLFFTPKIDIKPDFTATYNGEPPLVLDDIGNPRPGGQIFYSHTETPVPEDAVLTKAPLCTFPLSIPQISSCPIPAMHLQEARPARAGGFYPLGLFDNLHGGVHFPTAGAEGAVDGLVPVRAIAPGRIVAARLHNGAPPELRDDRADPESLQQRDAWARAVAGNSPNFVLIRHELLPSGDDEAEPVVFYCLYMHLAEPAWGGTVPQGGMAWLGEMIRRRLGSVIVVDPDADISIDGRSEPRPVGAQLWLAERAAAKTLPGGTLSVYPNGPRLAAVPAEVKANADQRTALLALDADADVVSALAALAAGEVVTFPEAHPSVIVDRGTVVGYAAQNSGASEGFLHWELLSPAGDGKGLSRLAELAGELDVPFETFTEPTPNNMLDDSERQALEQKLPEADRGRGDVMDSLSFAQPASAAQPLSPGHYHLKLLVKNHKGVLAAGTRKSLRIQLRGAGAEGEKSKDMTVDVVLGSSPTTEKIIEIPGWAATATVACDATMVRQLRSELQPSDLPAHLAAIAKSRWRNLKLRHINEWAESSMKKVLEELDLPNSDEILEALSFWGAKETPVYSSKKLFGGELPADTQVDNLHPILVLWTLNLLIERGRIDFVRPAAAAREEAPSKATHAGWLPATSRRPQMRAGEMATAIAVRDRAHGLCAVRLEAVAGARTIPLGAGVYSDYTFVVSAPLSAWGELDLRVVHGDEEQHPELLGAARLQVLEPLLSPATPAMPALDAATGRCSWSVVFDDNCPAQLDGYLVAKARRKGDTADPRIVDVALRIVASPPPPDGTRAQFAGGYLVSGPEKDVTEVVPGFPWKEVVEANGGSPPERVAAALLDALSALEATFKTHVQSEIVLQRGTLSEDGAAVTISAQATRGATAAQNNKSLLPLAQDLVTQGKLASATPQPEDAAEPAAIRVAVTAPPMDDTPGGALLIDADPRPLYGAALRNALADMGLQPEDEVEIFLGYRFYNGGHLAGRAAHASASFTSGEMERSPLVLDVAWDALSGVPCFERFSMVPAAVLALPRIGAVTLSYQDSGVHVDASLVGGDAAFWRAADVKITAEAQDKSISRATPATGRVAAQFYFAGKSTELWCKPFRIQVASTKPATFRGAEIAPGDILWTSEEIDPTPAIVDLQITPDELDAGVLHATVEVQGIVAPWAVQVWVTDPNGREDVASVEPVTKGWVAPSNGNAGYHYLMAGPDGIAKAKIKLALATLQARFKEPVELVVHAGRRLSNRPELRLDDEAQPKATFLYEPPVAEPR